MREVEEVVELENVVVTLWSLLHHHTDSTKSWRRMKKHQDPLQTRLLGSKQTPCKPPAKADSRLPTGAGGAHLGFRALRCLRCSGLVGLQGLSLLRLSGFRD